MLVSRLGILTTTAEPMTTLIITRRLFLITSLQSVHSPDRAVVRASWYNELY